jgi:hypothetical protein
LIDFLEKCVFCQLWGLSTSKILPLARSYQDYLQELILGIKPNPSKTTTNPPPLRLTLVAFSYSNRSIDEVLIAAKKLKESVKYSKVFINKHLTNVEIVQLKQLISIGNDSNKKL